MKNGTKRPWWYMPQQQFRWSVFTLLVVIILVMSFILWGQLGQMKVDSTWQEAQLQQQAMINTRLKILQHHFVGFTEDDAP